MSRNNGQAGRLLHESFEEQVMMWHIFEKWFNLPPWKGVEYITDDQGEKFWVYWLDGENTARLRARYRGGPGGAVTLIREDNTRLTLADIHIVKKYRERGIGKKLMGEAIQWAKENHFEEIYGFIKAHDGASEKYVEEWYKRQGFQVYEVKQGKYQIRMLL